MLVRLPGPGALFHQILLVLLSLFALLPGCLAIDVVLFVLIDLLEPPDSMFVCRSVHGPDRGFAATQ